MASKDQLNPTLLSPEELREAHWLASGGYAMFHGHAMGALDGVASDLAAIISLHNGGVPIGDRLDRLKEYVHRSIAIIERAEQLLAESIEKVRP